MASMSQYVTTLADHDTITADRYLRFKVEQQCQWMVELRIHTAIEDTINAIATLNMRSSNSAAYVQFGSHTDTITSSPDNVQFYGDYFPGMWGELKLQLNLVDTLIVSAWLTKKL